jgi:hypothetical protein
MQPARLARSAQGFGEAFRHDVGSRRRFDHQDSGSMKPRGLPVVGRLGIMPSGPSNSMLGCGSTTPQDYPERTGFAARRERECGHRRHCADANKETHRCASTFLAMTESPSAASHRPQSVKARLSSHQTQWRFHSRVNFRSQSRFASVIDPIALKAEPIEKS